MPDSSPLNKGKLDLLRKVHSAPHHTKFIYINEKMRENFKKSFACQNEIMETRRRASQNR